MRDDIVGGFFGARRVALVGASDGVRDPGSYNSRMTRSLLGSDLDELVLVTRDKRPIDGRPTLDDISMHDGGGDLCILAVSEARLRDAAETAIEAGWERLLVVTAQLSEPVKEYLSGVAPHRARIWGPNCLGFMDVAARHQFAATDHVFQVRENGPRIAVISQSGGGGLSIAVGLERLGLPPTHVAAVGDEYDISAHNVLAHFASGIVDAVVMFLEEARHPEEFLDMLGACQQAGIGVVIVKVGRTSRSRTMAQSHTGALVGDYDEFAAAVRQRGAILCSTLRDAAGTASLLATHGRRAGGRVAYFGSSGGMDALAPDMAEDFGIALADFSTDGLDRLGQLASQRVETFNPYDSANGGGTPKTLPTYLEIVAKESGVDLVIFMHNSDVYADFIVSELVGDRRADKPVVAVWPDLNAPRRARLVDAGVLVFEDLGDLCGPLGLISKDNPVSEVREAQNGQPVDPADDAPVLTYLESVAVLERSGVPTPWRRAVLDGSHIDQAVATASQRFPVVVKGANLRGHKSLVGGVVVGVGDSSELRGVLADFVVKFDGAIIEEQIDPGVDLLVAVRGGPFGGVVLVGFGGAFADVLGRQVVLSADLIPRQIESSLRASTVGEVLLGSTRVNQDVFSDLSELIARISATLRAGGLQEIELNPVIVGPGGAVACDVNVVARKEG